jgi:hypothetical protein
MSSQRWQDWVSTTRSAKTILIQSRSVLRQLDPAHKELGTVLSKTYTSACMPSERQNRLGAGDMAEPRTMVIRISSALTLALT